MGAGGNLARGGNRRARNINHGRGPGNIAGLGVRGRKILPRSQRMRLKGKAKA